MTFLHNSFFINTDRVSTYCSVTNWVNTTWLESIISHSFLDTDSLIIHRDIEEKVENDIQHLPLALRTKLLPLVLFIFSLSSSKLNPNKNSTQPDARQTSWINQICFHIWRFLFTHMINIFEPLQRVPKTTISWGMRENWQLPTPAQFRRAKNELCHEGKLYAGLNKRMYLPNTYALITFQQIHMKKSITMPV